MFFSKQKTGVIILFFSDLVIFFVLLVLAISTRNILLSSFPPIAANFRPYWWFFPLWLSIMFLEGAYTKRFSSWDEVKFIWRVSFFFTLAVLTIIFLGKLTYPLSRTFILLIGFLSAAVLPVLRISLKHSLFRLGLLKRKVLIFGAGETGKRALQALRRESNLGYEVVGFIDNKSLTEPPFIEGVKIHDPFNNVARYIKNCDVHDIVIAISGIEKEFLTRIINQLQHKAKSVLYIPDFSGMAVVGTELHHFFHDQVFALEIKNNLAQPLNYSLKRFLDFFVGLILFFILIIPLGIISLLIRLNSKGPAILRQERIGKKCKLFKCYKFRTMYFDAEDRLKTILATDKEAKREWETFWKLKNDPRVTPIGKFLRMTSLDELPQIYNVLKGEMSLVGPRPYLPREQEAVKEHSEIIHSVQPGITGLWQVSGRSNASYETRLLLDSWYVRNWNLWVDTVILMKTLSVVFRMDGAR